jgi:hypothetical protein
VLEPGEHGEAEDGQRHRAHACPAGQHRGRVSRAGEITAVVLVPSGSTPPGVVGHVPV